MAYTLMTAEQYVVNKLQDLGTERVKLLEEIDLLKEELNAEKNLLKKICKNLRVHHYDEPCASYIDFCTLPNNKFEPELFAELKRRIETHEV